MKCKICLKEFDELHSKYQPTFQFCSDECFIKYSYNKYKPKRIEYRFKCKFCKEKFKNGKI